MVPPFRKSTNILGARFAIARRQAKVSATPVVAFLEVANICNIRCRMCATTFDPRFRKGSDYTGLMDIRLLDRLEPILPGLWRAYLMGNGEPLINPKFLKFAKRLKSQNIEIQFNTNGMLLTEDISEALVDMKFDAIAISMDGADAATFNNIRHGADFDTVTANIQLLNEIKTKSKSNKPQLSLAAVALKDNWKQMPDLVDMAKELGMGHVHVESLIWQDDPGYQEYYREHSLDDIKDEAIAKLHEAQSKAVQSNIGFSSPLLDDTTEPPDGIPGTSKGIPCWEPWTTIFVTWQGDIHPCCGSEQQMGNLNEHSILEIWNNTDYQKLRHDFISGASPDGCQNCIRNKRMKRAIPTVRQWIKKALS